MRPERIVVGECRGGEALDMLQAMNTGHDGSMTTAHANTPRDTLSRLETMCLMAGMDLPVRAIREQIASAVDLIVQQDRLKDGTRKITGITEVQGMEGDVIVMQDIFTFQQSGIENGKIVGRMKPTGIRPKFMPRFEVANIYLPPEHLRRRHWCVLRALGAWWPTCLTKWPRPHIKVADTAAKAESMVGVIALLLLVSALIVTFLGLRSRRNKASTEDVMERMGRFATREDFLSITDGQDGKSRARLRGASSRWSRAGQWPGAHIGAGSGRRSHDDRRILTHPRSLRGRWVLLGVHHTVSVRSGAWCVPRNRHRVAWLRNPDVLHGL